MRTITAIVALLFASAPAAAGVSVAIGTPAGPVYGDAQTPSGEFGEYSYESIQAGAGTYNERVGPVSAGGHWTSYEGPAADYCSSGAWVYAGPTGYTYQELGCPVGGPPVAWQEDVKEVLRTIDSQTYKVDTPPFPQEPVETAGLFWVVVAVAVLCTKVTHTSNSNGSSSTTISWCGDNL